MEESPTRIILGALNDTYWIIGTILATGLMLAVAVSVYISRRISHPLSELSDAMDKFGSQNFTLPCVERGTQEIDHLQDSFYHMAVEITSLMESIQEREQQKRDLEVNFFGRKLIPIFYTIPYFPSAVQWKWGKMSRQPRCWARLLICFGVPWQLRIR